MALEKSPVTQFPSATFTLSEVVVHAGTVAIERVFTLTTQEQFYALKDLVDAIELGTIKAWYPSRYYNQTMYHEKIASRIPKLQVLWIDLDWIDFSGRKCSNFAKLEALSKTIPQLMQALKLWISFPGLEITDSKEDER